ncbi:hypothetical protein VBQ80_07480 [Klebsiella pneumoniae]|nr:hypothetical protein [Klebsiella pneumoniae]
MSIKEIINDSIYLSRNGRYLGAFTLLCAAIGGSSRKMYPEKFDRHKKTGVSDAQAFTNCLNIAISKYLHGNFLEDIHKSIVLSFRYKEKNVNFGSIIYHHYRCNLIHEASLPAGIKILDELDNRDGPETLENLRFIVDDDILCLGVEWLDFLVQCIVRLKVNVGEFNLENRFCVIKPPYTEETIRAFARENLNGRCEGITTYIGGYISKKLLSSDFDFSNHEQIERDFAELDTNNEFGGPMLFVLTNIGVLDRAGKLTQGGKEVIKHMSDKYQVIIEN